MDREQTGDDEAGLREPDRVFRVARAVHVIVLSVWAGAIIVAGATAALAFPSMKRLNAGIPGVDVAEEWRLVAGELMTPVFGGVYVYGGIGVGVIALVTGVAIMLRRPDERRGSRRMRRWLWAGSLVGALVLTGGMVATVGAMNGEFEAMMQAAEDRQSERFTEHRETFDGYHGVITSAAGAHLGLVLASVVLAPRRDGGIVR